MTKFSDLKLDPKVLKAIEEAGYENPTPIQAGAIPPALEGRDVLGIAQTGTGKTASFTLPTITLLGRGRARARMPRSLVLCPTRELAAQVAENFDIYAKYTRLTKALLIGGVSFGEQDKLIDRGVDVLIATPGRLLDHFERGKLLLTGVQIMVVDEADRMLDMGFIPDIERIFQLTPFTRQTLFFSATMAPEIERITDTFLHAPVRIEIARQATTSDTITQRLVELTPTRKDQTAKQKRELLRALINAEGDSLTNAIIFCNRKTDVDIVAKSLKAHGYDAAPIHGDLEQSHRTRTLESFRDGGLKFLVASDVAARGLDIPAVSHVFNFDLPSHAEDYVHRIGRTGRAGRKGTAISIATPSDEKLLAAIENLVKQTLPRGDLPEGFSVSESSQSAPRTREDRKGGRNGRRRGAASDGPRSDASRADAPRSASQHSDAAGTDGLRATPAVTAPQPVSEPRRDQRPAQGESGDHSAARNHRDNPRRGRRDDHRGPVIVGMGDHIPDFMLVEIRPLTSSDETTAEAEAPVEAAPAAKPEPSPRNRRRRRNEQAIEAETDDTPAIVEPSSEDAATTMTATSEGAPETPVVEPNTAAEPVVPDTAADTAADAGPAEMVPEAPAETAAVKPRRTRSRKTAAPEAATAEATVPEAEIAAEAPPAKPRRSRKKAVTEPTDAEAQPEAPKPARARRKKADPETQPDAAATSAQAEAEEKPAKPRRTRRKKADAETDAQASAEAASESSANADAEA